MFRREAPAPSPEVLEEARETVRTQRAPAAEPKAFQPSSFASRKAEAEAREAQRSQRRLVSLGATEFAQRNQRTGEVEYLAAELFMNLDKPMERFVSIDGVGGPYPVHSVDGKEDRVTPIPGKVRVRGPSQLTPPAAPDAPSRPV